MHLTWKPSSRASCLHAACVLCEGLPTGDAELAAALSDSVRQVQQAIRASGLPAETFWQLAPLCAGLGPQTGAEGSVPQAARDLLDAALGQMETVLRSRRGDLDAELASRQRPLREQWEARGPGLLRQVALATDPQQMASEARVYLTYPFQGGGGAAHRCCQAVTLEGVLYHPTRELPETLRLAWLLAQLPASPRADDPDAPHMTDTRRDRLRRLALAPAVLQAAERVDLTARAEDLLELALQTWHLARSGQPARRLAQILAPWWRAHSQQQGQDAAERWRESLGSLQDLLGGQ